jgi:hypothetical protein
VRQLAALVGSCAEQDAEQPKEELTEVDLEIMQGALKRLVCSKPSPPGT